MADNIIEISPLCPLKFKDSAYAVPASYNTKYFEDHHYSETLPYYYSADSYQQPWQKNDIIVVPIMTNSGTHRIEMINYRGIKVDEFIFNYVATSVESAGLKLYTVNIALTTYPEGCYKFLLKSGEPLFNTLETDWISLKDLHQGTLFFKYKHDENDFGLPFETGLNPGLRIHGGFKEFQPGSERTVFIDQPNNITQLSGKSFYTEKLVLGNSFGIPKYMVDKVNEIFLCSEVLIDGKQWVAVGGARFEANRIDRYGREGWTIEVRPAKNRRGNRFVNDAPAAAADYYVTCNIEGNLFGDFSAPASTNVIQIQSND